MIDKELENTRW